MKESARQFSAKPAVREQVPLLMGIMAPSGGGKTFSALRLATGMQKVRGGDIHVIDTEARRALHYADQFKFKHIQFDPPFGSLDYLAAIRQSIKAGAGVIVVDSMSHEHEGVGGLLDSHEAELDRLAGEDFGKRERMKFLAWQRPKAARRALIEGITQMNAAMIFCFRAKNSMRPMKNQQGKTEMVPQGYMPISGDEFLFEMVTCILLMPKSGGIPTWQSDNVGERAMIKDAAQFHDIFRHPKPLDESIGAALAQWAQGSVPASGFPPIDHEAGSPAGSRDAPVSAGPAGTSEAERQAEIERSLSESSAKGMTALREDWDSLAEADRRAWKTALDRRFKPAALEADAKRGGGLI